MSRHLRAPHFDGHAVGDPPLDFRPSIAGNTASCSNRTRLETLKYAGTAARPPPRARCLFPDLYRRFPDADELAMLRAWATANPRAACSAPCGAGRSRSRAPRTAMILLSCSIIPRRNANGTRRLSPRPSMPCAPHAPRAADRRRHRAVVRAARGTGAALAGTDRPKFFEAAITQGESVHQRCLALACERRSSYFCAASKRPANGLCGP